MITRSQAEAVARKRKVDLGANPTLYFCSGSDCQNLKSDRALREALDGRVEVCDVRCQKICKGPVVGLEIDGRIEWFYKMKSKSMRKRLVALVKSGELHSSLASRLSSKRSGRFRSDTAMAAK